MSTQQQQHSKIIQNEQSFQTKFQWKGTSCYVNICFVCEKEWKL